MAIEQILEQHQDELMAVPGVVGVGVGERAGVPVILVMLQAADPELKRRLPSRLDGFDVELEVTGEIVAF